MSAHPENDRKAFQKAKMLWLLDVARHPEMTMTAAATAIACADRVWGNARINENQSELGELIERGQPIISEGCRLLVKLGLLTLRVNGNRHIYSINFDAGSRPVPVKKALRGGAALSPQERLKRKKEKSNKTDPNNQPQQLEEYLPPQIDGKDVPQSRDRAGNISVGRLSSLAVATEHYTPDPSEGDAYGIPLPSEYADISGEDPTGDFDDLEQDRAPKGAVLSADHKDLAAICFVRLSDDDISTLENLVGRIGLRRFATELVNMGQRQLSGQTRPTVLEWVDRVGARESAIA